MKTEKEIEERITWLEDKIATDKNELSGLRQILAEMRTSLRVGDRVIYKDRPDRGVYILGAIQPGYSGKPKYFGFKIRKNGTPGVNMTELYRGEVVLAEGESDGK